MEPIVSDPVILKGPREWAAWHLQLVRFVDSLGGRRLIDMSPGPLAVNFVEPWPVSKRELEPPPSARTAVVNIEIWKSNHTWTVQQNRIGYQITTFIDSTVSETLRE
ncbi:hypothetical protein EJ06DRAFT_558420 [Trichodelitschia bisporula]|uniref:Uncharacterized protein n=1 Tax=Trichodelitschia bisporula TaxID=703511 RepID=A0A6G1HPL5_9PEZI|nr:hypothetical protein EJ06DRAFT_558420 [Trichodelitschia bisporula]